MEMKSMVQAVTWIVVDGLAVIWVLHMLAGIVNGKDLVQILQLMAKALCG